MDDGFEVLDNDQAASVRLYNPEGFDPRKYLPERFWKHADSARYFIHTIHHQRFMFKREKDAYIEIKAAYILPFFTDKADYKPVIEALKEAGVLECDGRYVKNWKSLGYRLGKEWRHTPFKAIHVRNPALVRKILDKRTQQQARITWDVHRYLRAWIDRLDFDHLAAAELVARHGWDECEMAVDALRTKELFFTHCDYGRVHHNVTSLKSELRQFLSYQGQELVNLDIRNSQPLFLSIVLINYLVNNSSLQGLYNWKIDNSGLYYDLSSSLFFLKEEPGTIHHTIAPLRLPELITEDEEEKNWKETTRRLIARDKFPEDVILYIELTQRGLLYEYLMRENGISSDKRNEFKKSFFGGVFFCKHWPVTKQAKVFQNSFPDVYKVITEIKSRDHRRLAHILQRTESSLIINRIARRCMEELPDTCVVTIHDSVMTTPDACEPVKKIITQEFSTVGLAPSIR